MTNEEIEFAKSMNKFMATPIGAAFREYDTLLGRAWLTDRQYGSSDREMKRDWDAAHAARDVFKAEIQKLQAENTRLVAALKSATKKCLEKNYAGAFSILLETLPR